MVSSRPATSASTPAPPRLAINGVTAEVKAAIAPSLVWLSDEMLFRYQRCQRRPYLDQHGDRSRRDPPSDYLSKIKQDSIEHRRAVLAPYQPLERPIYPARDWQAGAAATQALMQQGANYIHRGVLMAPGPDGVRYVSQPDLLFKQPGQSWLGDWCYVPLSIKLGKKPKAEYQTVATFYAYLLAETQGLWPETSWLVLREGNAYAIDLQRQVPRLQAALDGCLATLQADQPPEIFIARSRCDLCEWFSHCYAQAQQQQHLSLLPGVTLSRYPHLQRAGITTVESLAQTPPTELMQLLTIEMPVAQKLAGQAQATLQESAIARPPRHPEHDFPLRPSDLPSASVELYFDIEAAPDKDLIYLHGVLVVDYAAQTETFHALVAEAPDAEQSAWLAFLNLVSQHPQAPIYHFCPYEAHTVKRLSHQYGSAGVDIESLLHRFVDIHQRITEAVSLPVESYALKPIARWLGFEWRDEDANGAQSICWYDDWLTTGDRAYLNTILRYNEDDCRATYRIKDWLVQFSMPFWENLARSE
ncbi:TM0106 family RecB-like putative nuclease [Romeria aff. gracilis LEGE 07310]|uniref:TM0106 family RecB-like putative nuclease n=1 Tax=Vasconcelosia minhoensis LEGE 07310 TaxID=915328 RepID=A0A8J7AK66_9CYAN|nr:TM0106 family RecB-like putative nuclease [Romeria gracilis]MBE9076725.1 TM0106 family RecB-like putative nuclease [Romeria aff. gracilis LEGE 07310]